MLGEHLVVGNFVVANCRRVLCGICRVDAVDVLGKQDRVRVNLCRAQDSARIGREERVAGAAGEDHDAALLQMPDGLAADVGLCDLVHGDGRLHAHRHAALLEAVSDR